MDDEQGDGPSQQNRQIEIRVSPVGGDFDEFRYDHVEDVSSQPAQAASSTVLVECSGQVMSDDTSPTTRCSERSAKPEVPHNLKELDIDNRASPSPSTRASKRYAEETQRSSKNKRSCATRSTGHHSGDADEPGIQDHDPIDDEIRDCASSEHGHEKNETRTKRNSTTTYTPIYDRRYHPMDRTIPLNMAATVKVLAKEKEDVEVSDDNVRTRKTRSNVFKNTDNRRSQRGTRGKHSRNLQHLITPSTKRVETNQASRSAIVRKETESDDPDDDNLLKSLVGVNFDSLNSMDRILHNIQHGAPLDCISLPHSWVKVSNTLINEGFFTKDEYKSWGGTAALKRRYEAVRCVVQGEYADAEKTDLNQQPLYWLEDFDVLDLAGSKTIYEHRGIPGYMKGIEKFNQTLLDQKREEFTRSGNEASFSIVIDSKPSRISSLVAEAIAPDTQKMTGALLKDGNIQLKGMVRETGSEDISLHSEDSSVVVKEHGDQEAAGVRSSAATSPAGPVDHDSPFSVPNISASMEHSAMEVCKINTTATFVHDSQTPKEKAESNRRSQKAKLPNEEITIHEDPPGSTPKASGDITGSIQHQEDSKENASDEEDNIETADHAESDGISDSPVAAFGQGASGQRILSSNRGDVDLDLPPNNVLRVGSSQPVVQSARVLRTSSTITTTIVS